jgi:NADH-quinone oxidoreductase subunit E
MPEIYDERKDPNAWRRSGLPARPMRNPARWDEAIDTDYVNGVVDGFGAKAEALVAIFSAVQAHFGYLPERALRLISTRMTIHWAQVFGAASLGGFRLLPAEGHVITVCDCAACHFAGGDKLLAAMREELGIAPGETTQDGSFTLETNSDVGAGAIAPAIRVDTLVYGPLSIDQARHLIHERRHAPASVGGAPATAGSH